MQVIDEHRKRIAYLRDTVDTLMARHRKLFDLRSESWHEQLEGDRDRQERLDELHREIDEVELQIQYMKEGLNAIEPSGGLAPKPADADQAAHADPAGAAQSDPAAGGGDDPSENDRAEGAAADAAGADAGGASDEPPAGTPSESPDDSAGEPSPALD